MIRILSFLVLIIIAATPAQARDKFLDIKPVTSPGGLTAWLIEDHTLPMIALQIGFRGAGSINDPTDKQGLARLLSNTLDEGAGPYDSQAFQKALEDDSISLSFSTGRDHFSGSVKTLTATRDKAFELLRLALSTPRFETEAIARMAEANMTRIRSDMIDGDWIAARLLNDRAFTGHPYANNSGGTLTSLKNITATDLRNYKNRALARDNLVVAVVGDMTPDQVAKTLDNLFKDLPEKNQLPPSPALNLQHAGETFLYQKDMPQTVISLALPGIMRADPDYPAAIVMNYIFGGGGFGSRLMDTIREKNGLTYGIYSGLDLLDHVSLLSIGTSTRNDQAAKVLALTRTEMENMKKNPVTSADLDSAKGYLLGSMPTALTSTDKIAGILLSQQLDQRPVDDLETYRAQIQAVTVQDVQRLAAKLLDPAQMLTILVGKPENVAGATPLTTLPNVE